MAKSKLEETVTETVENVTEATDATETVETSFPSVDSMSPQELNDELESLSKELVEKEFSFTLKLSDLKKVVKHLEKNSEWTHQNVTSYLNLLSELRSQSDSFHKSSDVSNSDEVTAKLNYTLIYPLRDFIMIKGGTGYTNAREYVELINSVGTPIDAIIVEFSKYESRLRELHTRLGELQQEADANGTSLDIQASGEVAGTSTDVEASAE